VKDKKIQIIPDQDKISEPLFKTVAEYESFRLSFLDKVEPELEKLRTARINSERESFFRIVK
jgi:hypothetical protein